MEAYLFAKRLTENREQASKYFVLSSPDFDHRTFAIYAELGASDAIVADLLVKLNSSIETMTTDSAASPLLFDPSMSVALLDHPDRLSSVQKRLQRAEEDVRSERDQAKEKQKLLDASDQIRDMATRASAARPDVDTRNRIPGVPNDVEATWAVAVGLLGSGAERLHADTKRDLVQKVVRLAGLDCRPLDASQSSCRLLPH